MFTLLAFRFQQKWQEQRTERALEKQKFGDLMTVLSEMKRAIDRCQGLLKKAVGDEKIKSFSTLYVRGEEIVFPHFFRLCDRYDIINTIFATYSLFKWVNWNIDLGIHPEGIDADGKTIFSDRYGAAIGFIQTYLWGAAKNFNEVLDYAKELEEARLGAIPNYLVPYDLTEIENIPNITTGELN